jgi:hypothetical protein
MVKSPWSITGRQKRWTSRVAGRLLLRRAAALLLGDGAGETDMTTGECQEKFTHRVPSFDRQEILFPNSTPFGIDRDGFAAGWIAGAA